MIYHVSISGSDLAAGTREAPFRTINRAAAVAAPGDTVQVHSGEYREWVDPKTGGLSDDLRITFEAAPGERVVIKGSEIVTGWERVKESVWKTTISNNMFGDWNPFAQRVEGDWMCFPEDYNVHLGDVYINGVSMFEASSEEDLYEAPVRTLYMKPTVGYNPEYVLHPERSIYRWLAQVDTETTTLFCNFHEYDPNENLLEINVRKCCFFPKATGINYITVRGFEMCHAACPFAPPTAEQFGLLGPHWSKGWIIENNHIHDAKCSGISLGKDALGGDNMSTNYGRKSGHQYELESTFLELQAGWSKEKIGSHIVRNNVIHDCGQNGIVGHMGGVFSVIEHNLIYDISQKREYWGHELGGIKLHASIDTVIRNNCIHNTTLGIWLDWQAQGTRVTGNLLYDNARDFMVEVSHGPCTVDNNIMLSVFAMDNHAQGTAFVNNMIAGAIRQRKQIRNTPYHVPHSTMVAGFVSVYGGDDRLYNNMFLGVDPGRGEPPKITTNFCQVYDAFTTPEEYSRRMKESGTMCYETRFNAVPQPVWIEGNAYAGYAKPFREEKGGALAPEMNAFLEVRDGKWYLTLYVPETVFDAQCVAVTSKLLGMPRIAEQPFVNPDGSPIDFTVDRNGCRREGKLLPGPFAELLPGTHTYLVWE